MKRLQLFALVFISVLSISKSSAQNSVLAEGVFYKLSVNENNIYKITPDFLSSIGINVSNINPNNIKIYGNGGGMLPQANEISRHEDLQENPVYLFGGADNSFDNGDYLLFYGEDAHNIYYDGSSDRFKHEFNLYDDKNYYFLTISDSESKKINNIETLNETADISISYFDDFIYREIDNYNRLESGRMWFEDIENSSGEYNYKLPGILPDTDIKLDIAVMSMSFLPSNFEIAVNQLGLENLDVEAAINSAYGIKGRIASQSYNANSNVLFGNELELSINYKRPGSNSEDKGFLDYYDINYQRELKLYDDFTIFRNISTKDYDITEFNIEDLSSTSLIWDITNPTNTQNQLFEINGSSVSFKARTKSENNIVRSYIVFNPENVSTPDFAGNVSNQNLHGISSTNLLIVTPLKFISHATRLANFRRSNDNLTVNVVTTEEVYNEFSSGRQDITAIRDFARRLYLNDPNFKYLLLFGDGSYDYKSRISPNTNQIPVYESRESLHDINSFSSDDYFGYLDEHEGYWFEDSRQDESLNLDIGIGRLPVNSLDQAKAVVDKLIYYSSNLNSLGDWRNKVVLVADDGNGNTHQNQADELGEIIETTQSYRNFNTNRLFIDAYPQESTANGKISPIVKEKLESFGKDGALILNYTGHGSETQWTSEAILTSAQVSNWNNLDNLPLLVTATCEFGRYDGRVLSGAEAALLNPNGGAIGLLTTTRSVYSSQNRKVNIAFYNNVFPQNSNEELRIGDVMKKTKDGSISGISNRNFTLLGDPSLKLAYPKEEIVIKEINENQFISGDPVTLRALEEITVVGEIQNNGTLINEFDGTLYITVYEKMADFYTYGDKGGKDEDSFSKAYSTRENIIYKGKASVDEGQFTFSFIVPKDIDYTLGNGKISLYAKHSTEYRDAGGGTTNILIGESVIGNFDNTAPEINAYMNNEDFKSGDVISGNGNLIINLFDQSGINILGTRPGHEITAIIDENIENPIILNSYYEAFELNNYQKGLITYPISNLTDGQHTIKITAWDNYNNSGSTTVAFHVTGEKELTVNDIYSYPNPSHKGEAIVFKFSHNRIGESLRVQVYIYNSTGQIIRTLQETVLNSSNEVDNLQWDTSNENLRQGLYFYKVFVKSLTTNLEGSGKGKFFIVD